MHYYFHFIFKEKKEFIHEKMNSLSSGQAMSPMALETASNTFIEQNDGVHSTDGKDVCNMKNSI